MSLGPCKTDLSHPPPPSNRSKAILLLLLYLFYVYFWEISAYSAYDMFYKYKCLIVNLVFSPPRCLEWEFHSDCAFS